MFIFEVILVSFCLYHIQFILCTTYFDGKVVLYFNFVFGRSKREDLDLISNQNSQKKAFSFVIYFKALFSIFIMYL